MSRSDSATEKGAADEDGVNTLDLLIIEALRPHVETSSLVDLVACRIMVLIRNAGEERESRRTDYLTRPLMELHQEQSRTFSEYLGPREGPPVDSYWISTRSNTSVSTSRTGY